MKIKPFASLNVVAAYRKHGQRYAVFSLAKATFMLANVALSVVSLIAAYPEWGLYQECRDMALLTIKLTMLLVPYLAFEAIYWSYRLRRQQATAGLPTTVAE